MPWVLGTYIRERDKTTHGASMCSSTKNNRLALLSFRNSGEHIRWNSSLSTSFRSELAMTNPCARRHEFKQSRWCVW